MQLLTYFNKCWTIRDGKKLVKDEELFVAMTGKLYLRSEYMET